MAKDITGVSFNQSEPNIVEVNNLHKSFGERLSSSTIKELIIHPRSLLSRNKVSHDDSQKVLRGISFSLKEGDFFGIVGRNGSGKSTLLKILAGIYQATEGTVRVQGRVVPFIELGVGFNGDLTGQENVYLNGALLGFSREEVAKKYADIVAFAELEDAMGKKLKNYSSGMQVRLAFSIATRLAESDVLLIDEVLAVGDADFQRKCFNYFKGLKKQKKTVILITHDMNAVREYCNKAMLINDGEVVVAGSPEKVSASYTRMFQEQEATNEELAIQEKHWGSKEAVFNSPKINKKILRNDQDTLSFEVIIKSKIYLDEVVAGISVIDSGGTRLFGTNNKMENYPLKDLQKDTETRLKWEIPHIFNEGEYTIGLSLSDTNGYMYDSWDDVASFKVYKEMSTSFPVDPPIRLTVN